MTSRARIVPAVLAFLFLFFSCFSPVVSASDPYVVIINSYHHGYAWSDAELDGLVSKLREVYPGLRPAIEHMDAKRFPDAAHVRNLKDFLKGKYQGRRPDLVIAVDNSALRMLLRYRAELFPESPVVFAGINDFSPAMLAGHRRVTGVAEVLDIKGTLEIMESLHPGKKRVLVLHDYTVTGLALRKETEVYIPEFQGRLTLRFLPPTTFREAVHALESLPDDSLALIVSYSTDREGRSASLPESTRILTSHAHIPVYATHETRLGYGIVGGSLIGGYEHGSRAGDIALKVLGGEDPSSIPVEVKSTSRPMFDYRMLDRFSIPLSALPEGSKIINGPRSFYELHKSVALGAAVLLVLLSLLSTAFAMALIRLKRSGRALKKSEERYRLLIDTANEGIWSMGKDHVTTYVNRAMADMLGYSPSEITGKRVEDFFFPEDMPVHEARMERRHAGEDEVYERRFRKKGGAALWTLISAKVLKDEEGRFAGSYAMLTDITERKKAEEALRQSEEKYRTVADFTYDWEAWVDPGRVYRYVSPSCERLTGYRPEEFIENPELLVDITHPEDRPFVSGHVRANLESEDPGQIDFRIITRNGEERWVNHFCQPIYAPDGRFLGRRSSNRDITARKLSEDALRQNEAFLATLLDAIPIPVFYKDTAGRYLGVNRTFETYFGASKDRIVGNLVFGVSPPEFAEVYRTMDTELFEKGGTQYYESQIRNVHGEIRDVVFRKAVFTDSQGAVGGLIGTIVDITERKKAEEALRANERRYRTLFDEAIEGIALADFDTGTILDCNRAFERLTGYDRSDLIGNPQSVLHPPEDEGSLMSLSFTLHRSEEEGEVLESLLVTRDGTVKDVDIKAHVIEVDGRKMVQSFFHDMSEERRGRREKETALAILRLLNDQEHTRELILSLTGFLQKWTGCEAVGVRLKEGDDFPYYETRGFPAEFVTAENSLCIREKGRIVRDDAGNPVLECMCGNILSGRFDPSLPFFTEGGSFWTNSTTDLLTHTTEEDRHARTRNRCNGEGYESVALIPLKHRGTVLGLLQLNDHRRNKFSPEIISFLESACEQVAIALAQRRAQAALRVSEERFRDVSEAAGEYIYEVDPEGRLTFISSRVRDVLEYAPEEVLGKNPFDFVPSSDTSGVRTTFHEHVRSRTGFRDLEHQVVVKSGRTIWLSATVIPIFDRKGEFLGYRGAAMDITARKEAEEKIKASLREKEVLLKEIHHRVKNNLQVMSSLLNLQSRYLDDPKARDIFRVSMDRVKTMALIHDKLYQSENLSRISFPGYVADLAQSLVSTYAAARGIDLDLDIDPVSFNIDTAIPLGLIITELLSNSLKHAFSGTSEGTVSISLKSRDTRVTLVVSDTGAGFPESIDFRNTASLGMQLVTTLVEQLEGAIELRRGAGTEFRITFTPAE